MEDSDPLVGERAQRGLVWFTFATLLSIVGARPERARDGESGPFDESLSKERRTLPTPVHPAGVAAAFGDWGDAGVALQIVGGEQAIAIFAKRSEQPRSEGGPGGGEAVEDWEVGMLGRACGDFLIEGMDRLQGHTQLLDQALNE